MPIDTEEARAWIAEVLPDNRTLYGSEIPTAALMMQKASLQVQLEILDELRAIRVAVANRKKTIAQAHSLGHLDDEPLGEQKRPYGETFSAFTAVKRHIDVGFVPRPAMEIRDARLEVRDVGDDNAFAGEVRELKERGRDRRNGDRRIFEATCLTANKRNVNREDRRQGERRRLQLTVGTCRICGESEPFHFPSCSKMGGQG